MTQGMQQILEPDHLDRADRFARGIVLASSFDYLVAVVHNTELAEPFVRRVAGSCVTVDGAPLVVRWFRWAGVKDAIDRLEGLRDAPSSERHLVVFDLSQVREGELDAATTFARGLNLRRDVLPGALHGGMLLCIPDWLERHFAAAAPDFWSVVSSAALRRGLESFPQSVLDEWWAECDARFEVKRATLPGDTFRNGTFTIAYGFEPGAVHRSNAEFLETLERVDQRAIASMWQADSDEHEVELRPYPASGRIEYWHGSAPHPYFSTFWRASRTGLLYLQRTYLEEVIAGLTDHREVIVPTFQIGAIGEALLHARDLGQLLDLRDHTRVRIRARWTGLLGRELFNPTSPHTARHRSHTSETTASTLLDLGDIKTALTSQVEILTRDLFESFGFYQPSTEAIAATLKPLAKG